MEINLSSPGAYRRVAARQRRLLAINARVVCVSSMAGIAGNPGPDHYAASRDGVIGMVPRAWRRRLAETGGKHQRGRAPGSSQTAMTDAMPFRSARSRETSEQPAPGRSAGRRGGDDRVAGEPGVHRGERKRDPGLRTEPARGMIMPRTLAARRACPRCMRARPPRASRARGGSPFLPGGGGPTSRISNCVLKGFAPTPHELEAYRRLCGFGPGQISAWQLPAHPGVPGAHGADDRPSLPVRAGRAWSHVENAIHQHRPIPNGRPLDLRVRAGAPGTSPSWPDVLALHAGPRGGRAGLAEHEHDAPHLTRPRGRGRRRGAAAAWRRECLRAERRPSRQREMGARGRPWAALCSAVR